MNKIYHIYSLNLVAYLLMYNIRPISVRKEKEQNIVFYFNDNDELRKILDEYKNENKLKKFISCFKEVREMIKIY